MFNNNFNYIALQNMSRFNDFNATPHVPKNSSLHLPVCLFATIVIHAYYRRVERYHHMYLILIVSTFLLHSIQGKVVTSVTKILSQISFIMIVMETPKVMAIDAQWILWFPFATLCVYFTQFILPGSGNILCLCKHWIAVLGTHTYLWVLY